MKIEITPEQVKAVMKQLANDNQISQALTDALAATAGTAGETHIYDACKAILAVNKLQPQTQLQQNGGAQPRK